MAGLYNLLLPMIGAQDWMFVDGQSMGNVYEVSTPNWNARYYRPVDSRYDATRDPNAIVHFIRGNDM